MRGMGDFNFTARCSHFCLQGAETSRVRNLCTMYLIRTGSVNCYRAYWTEGKKKGKDNRDVSHMGSFKRKKVQQEIK